MPAATSPGARALHQVLENSRQIARTLEAVRALHMAAYTSRHPVEECAPELFYALGDLLEGASPESLELRVLDREAFLAELRR